MITLLSHIQKRFWKLTLVVAALLLPLLSLHAQALPTPNLNQGLEGVNAGVSGFDSSVPGLPQDFTNVTNTAFTPSTQNFQAQAGTAGSISAALTNANGSGTFDEQTQQAAGQAAAGQAAANPTIENVDCGYLSFNTNCFERFLAHLSRVTLHFFAIALSIAGYFFEICIKISVVDFYKLANLQAIDSVWQLSRDISNMFFVFVMLYIAIGTVLDIKKVDYKPMVIGVMVAAVTINFSMLAAKAIIDPTNIFALQFYNEINRAGQNIIDTDTGKPVDVQVANTFEKGISAIVVNALDISSVYNIGEAKGAQAQQASTDASVNSLDFGNIIMNSLLGIIFILGATFVILTAAFLFLFRAIVLLVLLAFAPFPFLFKVIPYPKLQNYHKLWWSTLFDQAIWAPVYMFLLYFAIFSISKLQLGALIGNSNAGDGGAALNNLGLFTDGNKNIFISYGINMAFLLSTIYVAKEFGAMGLTFATDTARSITTRGARALSYIAPPTLVGQLAVGARQTFKEAGTLVERKDADGKTVRDNAGEILYDKKGFLRGAGTAIYDRSGATFGKAASEVGQPAQDAWAAYKNSKVENPLAYALQQTTAGFSAATTLVNPLASTSKDSEALKKAIQGMIGDVNKKGKDAHNAFGELGDNAKEEFAKEASPAAIKNIITGAFGALNAEKEILDPDGSGKKVKVADDAVRSKAEKTIAALEKVLSKVPVDKQEEVQKSLNETKANYHFTLATKKGKGGADEGSVEKFLALKDEEQQKVYGAMKGPAKVAFTLKIEAEESKFKKDPKKAAEALQAKRTIESLQKSDRKLAVEDASKLESDYEKAYNKDLKNLRIKEIKDALKGATTKEAVANIKTLMKGPSGKGNAIKIRDIADLDDFLNPAFLNALAATEIANTVKVKRFNTEQKKQIAEVIKNNENNAEFANIKEFAESINEQKGLVHAALKD